MHKITVNNTWIPTFCHSQLKLKENKGVEILEKKLQLDKINNQTDLKSFYIPKVKAFKSIFLLIQLYTFPNRTLK